MKDSLIRFVILSIAIAGSHVAAQVPSDNPPAPPAQEQTPAPMDAQKQVEHLAKKLALTADQQDQIVAIVTDRQQQVASVHVDTTLDDKQRRAKIRAIRSDAESRVRNLLTDAQRASYDEMQQQARDRAKARKQAGLS